MESYDLTEDVKASLNIAFGNFLKDQNDRASNYVAEMQKDPFVRDKESYAVNWNKELVTNIISKMVHNLKATDINQSFKEDINILIELYKIKQIVGKQASCHVTIIHGKTLIMSMVGTSLLVGFHIRQKWT